MQADDPVLGPVAEDGDHASPGDLGGQNGPRGHEGPERGGGDGAGAVGREPPQAAQARNADAESGLVPRIPRPDTFQFSILVPFRSSVEAVRACHFLAPRTQPQLPAVEQELIVSGSLLAIRLTAEDMDQLRISISSCIHELCLLIRTMRSIVPPFFYINPRTVNGG